jgi:hypothetical protein
MAKQQFSYSDGRSKCDECARNYVVRETTERLSDGADNPLFVQQVIGHFAKKYGQSLAMIEFVCVNCVQQRWDEVLDANSMQDDGKGHYILTDNDEFFGRREDEEGGSVVTKAKAIAKPVKAGTAEAQVTPHTPYKVAMVKGDYKGKTGEARGTVQKGYWTGVRVELSTGKVIDVQESSFTRV